MRKIFTALFIIVLFLSYDYTTANIVEAAKKAPKSQVANNSNEIVSVLPKRGDIAIIVEGDDEQFVRIAESRIIDSLIGKGYRVVDEAKMKQAKLAATKAQAARYAMQGNVAAILKLNHHYSCAATIVARVQVGQPVQNQFNLYTGNASVAILAVTSNGTKLGGKTSLSKQVAYTEYETQVKSIEAAVDDGMKQLY